jgi:hypothetical protein
MPIPGLDGLFQAGGAIAGAAIQNRENRKMREMKQQQFAQNYQLQRDSFERGLQTKMRDAKAAGIHPLAALEGAGAQAGSAPGNMVEEPSIMKGAKLGAMLSQIRAETRSTHGQENRDRELHEGNLEQQAQDLESGEVSLEYHRERITDLIEDRIDQEILLQIAKEDHASQEIIRAHEAAILQIKTSQAEQELLLLIHDSYIIRNSGLTSSQKANMVGTVLQGLGDLTGIRSLGAAREKVNEAWQHINTYGLREGTRELRQSIADTIFNIFR